MNMEHKLEIYINFGEVKFTCPDLIEAAKILTGATTSEKLKVEGKDIGKSLSEAVAEPLTEAAGNTDPSELSDASAVKNDYPSVDPKTYKEYEQFKHMIKKLSELEKVSKEKAQSLLKSFSTDNSTVAETVPPNAWGKVIAEAQDLLDACNKKEEAAPAPKITLEDMRIPCKAFLSTHGKKAMEDLFREFGVKSLPELPSDRYTEFLERVGNANG